MADSNNQIRLSHTDASLLARWSQGDQQAAEELFARHSPRLLSMASSRLSKLLQSRLDPDDIVQSTFKSFFRRAGSGGYVVPESGDLFNLLIVIAMRKVNARSAQHQAACRDIRKTMADADPSLFEDPQQSLRELYLTIEEVCEGFSELQKKMVTMRLEGFSVAEISARCQRSKRTVERELQQFRRILSRYFEP